MGMWGELLCPLNQKLSLVVEMESVDWTIVSEFEALDRNEQFRRREFPVVESHVYLSNAQVCALPRRVADAIGAYATRASLDNQEQKLPESLISETRELIAELLVCDPSGISFVGATSVALSLVANGLDLKEGDNVVFNPDDYPSNAVVWVNLKDRGVELRPIVPRELGVIRIEDLRPLVNERTKLVALTSAHFISGYVTDLTSIGAWLRERGILFAVDGIQTVGAIPTPTDCLDYLASDSYKWLLGPCASGWLFVNPSARAQLNPSLVGWNNVVCPNFITPEKVQFKDGPERYEAGSLNLVGIAGLNASLKLLRGFGYAHIAERVRQHAWYLRDKLRTMGFVLASSDDERISGITSFRRDGFDMERIFENLKAAGVTSSLRLSRDGRWWVRFSPHFFNTRAEIDHALALLRTQS